jgi:hypothetical protein
MTARRLCAPRNRDVSPAAQSRWPAAQRRCWSRINCKITGSQTHSCTLRLSQQRHAHACTHTRARARARENTHTSSESESPPHAGMIPWAKVYNEIPRNRWPGQVGAGSKSAPKAQLSDTANLNVRSPGPRGGEHMEARSGSPGPGPADHDCAAPLMLT